jgi:signal transduction histidine kinase
MRILIAEDDTTSRMILAEVLAQLGHEVVTAVDGQEAWTIFNREHVPLVISDWMMPDLDGIELTRRIRAENRARYTYVILLTALGGKENYLEAMRAGADDFASKPLDSDQLHARLRVAERILGLQRELVQLELSQQQIVQQERLRALGEMASGIAHDFNNALSVVCGFTDILLLRPEDLDDKERVTQRLQLIRTAGRDAAHLVSRLTEFYRPRDEAEVFVAVDLNEVIRSAVAVTEPRWKAQARFRGAAIRVETDLHAAAPRVEGNVSELRDVLMNLIFNAVDAMPRGGTLRIATEPDGTRDTVLLTVADSGTGMTPEVRRRCLEPFFTTKGERGTGLGLAMTYGVIKRHRGTIDVLSEPGEGTTFRIRLPAGGDRPVAPGPTAVEAVLRPLRVLVVEDEPIPRQVVVEYLTGDGHIVETAMNGPQGLQRLQVGGFDVVITDRAMPQMNGKLAAAIEQMAPRRPAVLMLSGFADEAGSAGELPPGVDVVLAKPVPLERLREALRRLT